MHQSFKSSPAFTFGSKSTLITSSNLSKTIPGPGQYSPNKQAFSKRLARQAFFAKSTRKQLFGRSNLTPGPGDYHQKLESSLHDSRISLRARLNEKKDRTPGPGQYNDYLKNAEIKYSFTRASKHNPFESKSVTPPPCQYQSKSSLSDHSIKIGSSSRKRLATNEADVPGPGAYKSAMDSSSVGLLMAKFSKSKRMKDSRNQKSPGPGAYETRSMFESPSGKINGPTISTKFKDILLERKASLPAPNCYNTRVLQTHRAAAYSMPKSSRFDLWMSKTRTSSSTDFYDYNKNPDKKIKIKFSKDEKLKPIVTSTKKIGPGQYHNAVEEILKLKQTSPNFTISKSQRLTLPVSKEKILNPGPAAHDSLLQEKVHPITIAKSNRPSYIKQGPGPGSYLTKIELRKSLEIKFARSQRDQAKPLGVPGPGAYEIKSRIPNLPQYK